MTALHIKSESLFFEVRLVDRKIISDFIEHWHYSHNMNGVMSSYCFALYDGENLIGAMVYAPLGMANTWKKYADRPEDVIELRRLCCIDNTPKNTESYFIGKTIRWLKQNTNIKIIVSYADCNQGHNGTIYKATNFTLIGKSSPGRIIIRKSDGKQFHDKAIRTKYNGKLKPFAEKLKQQLETGEAYYKDTVGKNIYTIVIQ
jgi:hypothetical protein